METKLQYFETVDIHCRHPIISMYVGRRMTGNWFTFIHYTFLFLRFKTLLKPANPFFSCTYILFETRIFQVYRNM
jgi:hypothetical protein